MAYLKNLKFTCDRAACTSSATQTLYNRYNAPCGSYCGKHAKEALKRLQEAEDGR